MTNVIHRDVIVIGGGLAGLTVASRLAKQGKKITLLEKGILGGRAITMDLKGFSFNFGAHAIYAKDKSTLAKIETELDLHLKWASFSKEKAKYDLGEELTVIPSDGRSLFATKMVTGINKIKFAWFVFNTMRSKYKIKHDVTIKEWMEEQNMNHEIQDMLLTLASSNFFTNEPEKIMVNQFLDYYKEVFQTKEPVSYLIGGWKTVIDEMKRVIESNGGVVQNKSKVDEVQIKNKKIYSIKVKDTEYVANQFVFCVPPNELKKLFKESIAENTFQHYASYEPTNVVYYDIGLKTRVNTPLSYVYDKENKVFVTDISYYDKTCVPEGGQLLQAVTYINEKDLANPNYFEEAKEKIERVYDKHFTGWRDELVVPRISKKAVVQEIKSKQGQNLMPTSFDILENAFFAGDWCKGKGQLSELSFSSAYEVTKKLEGIRK